jgi:hypothetical protein
VVSRLNALGDVLWWDPAYDQTALLYPPFFAWPDVCLDALWEAYGLKPDGRRTQIYALLQHVSALNGVYQPPPLLPLPMTLTEAEMIARLRAILALL